MGKPKNVSKRNRRVPGSRSYGNYSEEMLKLAAELVRNGQYSSYEAEKNFQIPRRTILNKAKNLHTKRPGGQIKLTAEEEQQFVNVLIAAADFGSPLTELDLRIIVNNYLKKNNRDYIFEGKMPGRYWVKNFLNRHRSQLTTRTTQNIKRARAEKTEEEFEEYFEHLKVTLADVPKSNVLNYDETNLADNPGSAKCIFRRSVKYPERVLNYTKGSISIMFATTASGKCLPTYTVYKSEQMWHLWRLNGPRGSRYNHTKSGWFDAATFQDWFESIVLPWANDLEGPKVIIGDNLSSHLNVEILKLCHANDIRFVFLPSNSTHIAQPLDVAFFGPLKKEWRKILTQYKIEHPHESSLNKAVFPSLLKELITNIEISKKENILSGFKATGIVPFNPNKVLRKLPTYNEKLKYNVDETLLNFLKENRAPKAAQPSRRNKKLAVPPGKSVSAEDIEMINQDKQGEKKKRGRKNKSTTPTSQSPLDIKAPGKKVCRRAKNNKSVDCTQSGLELPVAIVEEIEKDWNQSNIDTTDFNRKVDITIYGTLSSDEDDSELVRAKVDKIEEKIWNEISMLDKVSSKEDGEKIDIQEKAKAADKIENKKQKNKCVTCTSQLERPSTITSEFEGPVVIVEEIKGEENICTTDSNCKVDITVYDTLSSDENDNELVRAKVDKIEQKIWNEISMIDKVSSMENEGKKYIQEKGAEIDNKRNGFDSIKETEIAAEKIENKKKEEDVEKVEKIKEHRKSTESVGFSVGDTVMVAYYLRKTWKFYVGVIEAVDSYKHVYTIIFYKTIKNKNMLKFVENATDRDHVPYCNIVKKMQLLQTKEKPDTFVLAKDEDAKYF